MCFLDGWRGTEGDPQCQCALPARYCLVAASSDCTARPYYGKNAYGLKLTTLLQFGNCGLLLLCAGQSYQFLCGI